MKKKVLIVGSAKLPVPAVKGGAVPNLIEELVSQQQIENRFDLSVCSLYDIDAFYQSKKYDKTTFIWAKVPKSIAFCDQITRFFLKNIIKKERILSFGFVFQILWYAFFLSGILKKNQYDIVVFENSVQCLFSLKLKGNRKKYEGKYYIHMHSVPRIFDSLRKEFEEAKGIICISDYVAKEIQAIPSIHIEDAKIHIMYNCVNTDLFKPQDTNKTQQTAKQQYFISDLTRSIVFAGRLCKDKGIEVLFDAVKILKEKHNDIKLLIVGSNFYKSGIISPYENRLRMLAAPIKNLIFFTGYVDYSKMPFYYSLADVVVLPSMWEEPAGMTIIEAMACGKPVITTLSGGIPEYTGKGNCILVERDKNIAQTLANEINHVLDDNKYAMSLGIKAAKHASQFNCQYYYRQFADIIEEAG